MLYSVYLLVVVRRRASRPLHSYLLPILRVMAGSRQHHPGILGLEAAIGGPLLAMMNRPRRLWVQPRTSPVALSNRLRPRPSQARTFIIQGLARLSPLHR